MMNKIYSMLILIVCSIPLLYAMRIQYIFYLADSIYLKPTFACIEFLIQPTVHIGLIFLLTDVTFYAFISTNYSSVSFIFYNCKLLGGVAYRTFITALFVIVICK
ncbi:hypothetical protein BX070DRAFT_219278 [Coemansia spiralis]|nr:hypothetical protein BX070DRAFT_219278 [Coemansia spiralis]